MKTRIGKIARLPKPIRDQLNRRLENGESGTSLVQWLNQLPEVRKIITEQFARRPIRPQNLSEWRQGGYLDWQRHQLLREQTRVTAEQSAELGLDPSGNSISIAEDIATIMSAQLAIHVHSLAAIKNPKQHFRQFRLLSRELSRLRRDDQRAIRNQLLRKQSRSTPEPTEAEKALSEPKREIPPGAGDASVPASRAPLETDANKPVEAAAKSNPQPSSLVPSPPPERPLHDAPRNPGASPERASVPDCGSPLPLCETNIVPSAQKREENDVPENIAAPSSFCVPPSALPDSISPNPAKSGYKISGIPRRGRRFVCIEG